MPKPNQQNQDIEFSTSSNVYFVLTILAQMIIINHYVVDEESEIILLVLGSLLTIFIAPFVEIGYNQVLMRFVPARRKAASEEELQTSLRKTDELLVKLPPTDAYSSLLSEEREHLKKELEKSNPKTATIHQIRDAIVTDNDFKRAIQLTKNVILESAEDYPVVLDVWLAEFNKVNNNSKGGIVAPDTAQQAVNRLNLLLLEFINEKLKT
ncbi:MAG: hypothetical protein HC892_06275 [Saprospiraceae bacterium]|nr:hypothetical protein [Saprospiraceae bacterium]